MKSLLQLVSAVLLTAVTVRATPLQSRVAELIEPRLAAAAEAPADAGAVTTVILSRPDPETFFNRYIFGLQRNAAKLLRPEQATRLKEIIAQRSPSNLRWHDERNTLRCRFNEVMWRYAAASAPDAPALRAELTEWMRLRMAWTLQEHLADYEFGRVVWEILDPAQRKHLLAGNWKSYAKLDTGHARDNATGKIITRALGKPDNADAFTLALGEWNKQREALHRALQTAENNERRVGFAMDVNSPGLFRALAEKSNAAYAVLYIAEAEATRRLVQAGYNDSEARCAKAAAEAWSEAPKRFQAGAAELISIISKP